MSITVRSRLLMLMMSVLLPGILATLWLIVGLHDAENAALKQTARATTRALSTGIDAAAAPGDLQALIDRQNLPAGWVTRIVDASGTVLAQHPNGTQTLSIPRWANQTEGTLEWRTPDGVPMTGFFSSSPLGRAAVMTMPLHTPLSQAIRQLLPASFALLALAIAGAMWVSHTLVRDRKTLEQQLSNALERTRQVEQRAAQSQRVEAVGRVAAGVAHDLNNVLGVISNAAQLIDRQAVAPSLKLPAAATLRAVAAGAELTQHLLRLTGRPQAATPQSVDLSRHLPGLRSLLQTVLGRRIELRIEVAAGIAPVHVDLSELDLALVNLALNASEAIAGNGHVTVTAAPDRASPPAGDHVLITFSDDGTGIDEALIDKVFEPFFTSKPVGHGSGMGLSQVRSFSQQAGGRVWLSSSVGRGTTASLLLPAASADHKPPVTASNPQRRLDGTRVLLVEDNDALAASTMALLRSFGCQVAHASSTAEALLLVQAQTPVDVMLADLTDGAAWINGLHEARPALPIVLAGGRNQPAEIKNHVISLKKPYGATALFAALSKAIQ